MDSHILLMCFSDEQWERHVEGSSWGIVVLCNSVLFIGLLLFCNLHLLSTLVSLFCLTSYYLSSCLPVTCQTVLHVCTSVLWCYTVSTGKYLPTFKTSAVSSSSVLTITIFNSWLTITSQKCQECVELHLYSPICLHGMHKDSFSWNYVLVHNFRSYILRLN
jgi:hypothetical protein